MFDLLDEYLSHAVSPDIKAIVEDATVLFDGFRLEGWEDVFVEILSDLSSVDSQLVCDQVLGQVRAYQLDLLRNHGLTVYDEVRMSQLNLLIGGISQAPYYNNRSLIIERCSQDAPAEQIIADVIGTVMGRDINTVHTWIETASPSLIARLVEWVDANDTEVDLEMVRQKERRIAAYQWYTDHFNVQRLKLAHLLGNGLDVYHPAKLYLNMVGPDFNQMELSEVLHEFFAIALISSDYYDKPQALINETIETYVADAAAVGKILNASHEIALLYAQSDIFQHPAN